MFRLLLRPSSGCSTRILNPRCRVLLEKLTGSYLVNKIPTIYGTRRFITTFTSARHLSLSWASSIQSIPPHPTSWRSKLILSSQLLLGLPSGLFLSGFHTKTLYTPLLFPIRATCPAHLTLLDFITRTICGEEYRQFSSSLCVFYMFVHILSVFLCFTRILTKCERTAIYDFNLPPRSRGGRDLLGYIAASSGNLLPTFRNNHRSHNVSKKLPLLAAY